MVGLAVATARALKGREVRVLDAANAQLCIRGEVLLHDYCIERGIGHSRCGKLIVATSKAQVAQLQGIVAKAAANRVNDLVLLGREQALAMERQVERVAAIHSPSMGIVDSHALMLSL